MKCTRFSLIFLSFSIIALLANVRQTHGKRILLLCAAEMMNSHILELLVIGEELASRGHEVALPICPGVLPVSRTNSTKSSVQHLNYCAGRPPYNLFATLPKNLNYTTMPMKTNIAIAQTIFSTGIKRVLENTEFMQSLKDMKFDLAVVDGFFLAPYAYVIAHQLRLPYVTWCGLIPPYVGGAPLTPSIYSNYMLRDNIDLGSFSARLVKLWIQLDFTFYFRFFNKGQFLLTEYAPDVNSFRELSDRSMMFFITRDHILDYPQPFFPNVIQTTSLMYSPAKPLSGDIEQVYAEATNGVIVVSFGSMPLVKASRLTMQMMLDAFEQLEQTVVFKLDINADVPKLPRNVKAFAWLPQNDCLGHERTKLFITHGGSNGIYEALYHGIPMIGFPHLGDQPYNLRLVESKGFGVKMNFNTFSTEELVNNIRKILTDSSYSASVKKASAILKDRPMTPRQTIAYWIEHVIKHGHQHLRPHVLELAWYEYFMVDVYVFLIAVIGCGIVLIYYGIRFVRNALRGLFSLRAIKTKTN